MGLLVMLVVAGVLGVVFISTVVGSTSDEIQRDAATRLALSRAKEALISYAVTYIDKHPDSVPGFLPCPDLGAVILPEGSANGVCGAAYQSAIDPGENQLGRLPWYSLGIEPLRDGSGECLWYAVSATYKNSPEPAMLNWDSIGRFQIAAGTALMTGATDADLAVAVILAPGAPYGGQVRGLDAANALVCGGNYQPANYLDTFGTGASATDNSNPSTNAVAPRWRFNQGVRTNNFNDRNFNDRLVYITAREIWDAVVRRRDLQNQFRDLTEQVTLCLASYASAAPGDRRLPWAVPLSQLSFSLETDYYDVHNDKFGRTPFSVYQSDVETGYVYPSDRYLKSTSGPNGGRCATWTAKTDTWWKHWKDNLFYTIADGFTPGDLPPNNCIGSCLRVNSSGSYASIVLFAGRANSSQARYSVGLMSVVANYLDSPENTDVDVDYDSNLGGSFNDMLYCVNTSTALTAPVPGAIPLPDAMGPKFWVHKC
ncbi:MAG: hypothetical protein ABI794_00355 [Betaproteobacteria bacterium]